MAHFDELAARRNVRRRRNGQFGFALNSPPESSLLVPNVPADLEVAWFRADQAQIERAKLIVDEIDANMPAEALFAYFELNPEGTYFIVKEVCNEDGKLLGQEATEHVNPSLRDLGTPDIDFEGEMLVNADGEYGWDRDADYSEERAAESRELRSLADRAWMEAIASKQDLSVGLLWGDFPDATTMDFTFLADRHVCQLAGVHTPDGFESRPHELNGLWAHADGLAAYISEPEQAGMVYNELAGTWRLTRS